MSSARWTAEDLAKYEKRLGRVGTLDSQRVSEASGERAPGRQAPRARGSAPPPTGRKISVLEQTIGGNFDVMGLKYVRQFHMENIDATAKGWRFDFAMLPLELRVLVEIHGALGSGKHSRREGQTNDLQKANAATEHGWSVLSYGASQINSGEAALQVARLVESRRRALERRTLPQNVVHVAAVNHPIDEGQLAGRD